MICIKCNSPRIIKFLDGFGEWRIFCKSCQESFLLDKMNNLRDIKKLSEFNFHSLDHGAAH